MENIQAAVKAVLTNYAGFEGRAGRAEFWWWLLAYVVVYIASYLIGGVVGIAGLLTTLIALACLVPNIAVSVRRFHDIGMSGWWTLIFIIPIVGLIAMIYFFIKPSAPANQFGEGPASLEGAASDSGI